MSKQAQQIRKQMHHYRQQLSAKERAAFAQQATNRLITSKLFAISDHIGCYMAIDNEIDTQALIDNIWQQHKKCYLPIIDPNHYGQMHFAQYQQDDQLINNKWQIPEPTGATEAVAGQILDLVIMPLLAFDRIGNRLGTGGGYYDRHFANISHWSKPPILCGFAYDHQQFESLLPQSWDIPMNLIVTNQEIIVAGDDLEK